jgi:hypothetical protein
MTTPSVVARSLTMRSARPKSRSRLMRIRE